MTDRVAIQDTINLYHQAASLADYELMISTFAPDGVWEFTKTGQRIVGVPAIREAVAKFTGGLEYIAQINAPALITIDGDTATAKSTIRETGKFSGGPEGIEACGIYTDKLVRTAGGWKFAHRCFETRWMHRVQLVPA